jgi:hypothetical protein
VLSASWNYGVGPAYTVIPSRKDEDLAFDSVPDILIPVYRYTGMTTYYNAGSVPMYGEHKHCSTSCGQSYYSEAKIRYDRFLLHRTSYPLIAIDPPHPTFWAILKMRPKRNGTGRRRLN